LILILKIRKQAPLIPIETHRKKKNFFIEVGLWERIGKKLLPCMTVTFFLFIVEAFFWTLAPLYAENSGLGVFGGFFLAAYGLPILIAGLLIGNFVKKYSKTKIAFISLLIGSLILAFFALFSNVYLQIVIVFISALFFGIALPSISGTYSEYIGDVPVVEEEIEALEDFSYNVGYALGPIFAGLLSDIFNIPMAFTILGIVGFVIAVSLLIFTPKKIKIGMSDLNEKS
jgi:predicted MFS family arabinose efflux permease